MKILVACEYSGSIRRRLRAAGHNCWSCDLLPADDGAVVLKYHWLSSLRSDPPRELRPVSLLDVPVPFVSIDAGASETAIMCGHYRDGTLEETAAGFKRVVEHVECDAHVPVALR